MDNATVDKVIALIFFLIAATVLWNFFPYRERKTEKRVGEDAASKVRLAQEEVALQKEVQPKSVAAQPQGLHYASPLLVHSLSDKVTLLIWHYGNSQASHAQLLLWGGWSGKRAMSKSVKLGTTNGVQSRQDTVRCFVEMANQRLEALRQEQPKRRRRTAAPQQNLVVPAEVAQPTETAVLALMDLVQASKTERSMPSSIRLKKFPLTYRGIIKEVGMMKQCKEGREFQTFGVKVETLEGPVDVILGADLRQALHEASAGVGDQVEILKIGRKTVEAGKAPMNLFKVVKLVDAASPS